LLVFASSPIFILLLLDVLKTEGLVIDYLIGTVKNINEKTITLLVNGLGFQVVVPSPQSCQKDQTLELFVYMHWNQENGPSLFGFQTEIERSIFLLVIDCPKIGPSIGMSILSSMSPSEFLQVISAQNDKALSKINGIGEKKAEQIIVHLKHKVQKLLASGVAIPEKQQDFVLWQNVSDVLVSLNYSRQEVSGAMQYLTEKHMGQNCQLDILIRSALSYLSAGKM